MMRRALQLTCLATTAALAACGGGGGGQSAARAPLPVTACASGSLQLAGTITYDRVPSNLATNGLDYESTVAAPARQITVQLLNGNDDVCDTATTDDAGQFSFSVAENLNLKLRARAELQQSGGGQPAWSVQVIDNTQGSALYVADGAIAGTGTSDSTRDLHLPSGWTGSSYGAPRSAAPFAIADSIYEALSDFAAVDSTINFPLLRVNWSVDNRPVTPGNGQPNLPTGEVITSFYTRFGSVSNLVLLGAAGLDTDEYDDHVVIHEWGHYFEDRLSRSDSVGGPHGRGDRLDMRVAFGEGFGNALSGMVTDDPFYRDAFGEQQQLGFAINVESGDDNSVGWFSEASVQELLYDLYDSTNDAADSDDITLGLAPLYDILTASAYRSSAAFTSVFSYMTQLRAAQAANQSQIDQLLAGQQIVSGTQLDAFGANETNNEGASNVLPIYTTLGLGSNSPICSVDTFGTPNKLSNWRFGRFNVSTSGSYTFTLTGASDPDFIVDRLGQRLATGFSGQADSESVTVALNPGEHVLAMSAFANTGGGSPGQFCLTMNIEVD